MTRAHQTLGHHIFDVGASAHVFVVLDLVATKWHVRFVPAQSATILATVRILTDENFRFDRRHVRVVAERTRFQTVQSGLLQLVALDFQH